MLVRRVLVAMVVLAGCGRVGFAILGDLPSPDGTGPADAMPDAIACTAPVTMTVPDEGTMHADAGTPIAWTANPPSSGTHYPDWVHWNRVYEGIPIERGYWVHNLEHGGTVFLYNCTPACPEDVDRLRTMLAALPTDPDCPADVHRGLVVEDLLMPPDVRFAAVAWDHSWTSNCVDEASLAAFYNAHLNMSPEFNCTDGTYPPP